MPDDNKEYMAGFDEAIDLAVEIIDDAREDGETDLRQVRYWIESLKGGSDAGS